LYIHHQSLLIDIRDLRRFIKQIQRLDNQLGQDDKGVPDELLDCFLGVDKIHVVEQPLDALLECLHDLWSDLVLQDFQAPVLLLLDLV
jgi:hypothetical protein